MMIFSRLSFFLILICLQQIVTSPINDAKAISQNKVAIQAIITPKLVPINNHERISVIVPFVKAHQITKLNNLSNARKQKSPNLLPVPHQLLVPAQLHVIPIHTNFHHNAIHNINVIRNENQNFVSHTITHSASNNTRHAPLYFIPIHHTHLVPFHDLSVIPLQRQIHPVESQIARYRAPMERKDPEDEEPLNKFRSFYGGYGNGLFFGGHGAGHGFYAYG